MTTFSINLHLTSGARSQLAGTTESVCLTLNNNNSQDNLPAWVSFYNGCPVGINPINLITWSEAWTTDYSTQVFDSDGTLIQGAGDLSSSQLGHLSAFKTLLDLNSSATWKEVPNGSSYMMQCNNDHNTPITFIYYVKTGVNAENFTDGTSHPVYTSVSKIENGGTEEVNLIQTVNLCYRGQSVTTDTIIAQSGSQHWTTLTLNEEGTTDMTGDYTSNGGWIFYLGKPAQYQLTEGTDTLLDITANASTNGIGISGTLTVKESIGVAVAFFILGSVQLKVTKKISNTFFSFFYNGPATLQELSKYIGKVIKVITSSSHLASIAIKEHKLRLE